MWFVLLKFQLGIKCPTRDPCLYLGQRGERVDPQAVLLHISVAYSLATTGWILFKFSICMQ